MAMNGIISSGDKKANRIHILKAIKTPPRSLIIEETIGGLSFITS